MFDGQAISFSYDADERLSVAGELSVYREQMSGLISELTMDNYHQLLIYNQYGEVEQSNFSLSGNGFFSQVFTRDKLGRISSKVENAQGVTTTWDYFYDLSGRLTSVRRNGAGFASYDYSPNNNRIGAMVGGQTISATYDAQDRLLTYGSNSYAYDAHGNLLSRTNSTTGVTTHFTYDVFGQLKKVASSDGQTVEYATDGENHRAQVKLNGNVVRSFFYNEEGQLVASINASGSRSQFIYASQSHSPDYMTYGSARYFFVKDLNGSIRRVINVDTNAVAQSLDYDEFGRVVASTNPDFQPFGFAGGVYDSVTGLVRFGARDYDPETGRWLSKDPIGFAGGDTNLYGYVLNDPVNFTDPAGLSAPSSLPPDPNAFKDVCILFPQACMKRTPADPGDPRSPQDLPHPTADKCAGSVNNVPKYMFPVEGINPNLPILDPNDYPKMPRPYSH